MSVTEYTKNFTCVIPFVATTYPTERSRINLYPNRLPWEYELEVKRATTLGDAIIIARNVEDVGKRRALSRQFFKEKRGFRGSTSSNKKIRFSFSQSK